MSVDDILAAAAVLLALIGGYAAAALDLFVAVTAAVLIGLGFSRESVISTAISSAPTSGFSSSRPMTPAETLASAAEAGDQAAIRVSTRAASLTNGIHMRLMPKPALSSKWL